MTRPARPRLPRRPRRSSQAAAWGSLPWGARAYRVAHAAWAVVALSALGYIWTCALGRRRDRYLGASVTFLMIQGGGLVVGRGDCPLGPLQHRLGDPAPLFELVLPPRAARAAVPVLTGVVIGGLIALVVRPPR